MNNTHQLGKGNGQINSTLKMTGSGRLKRHSKDLGALNTSSKKPFLKQYSIAMEQKLQHLKEKINEKKKQKSKEQSLVPSKIVLDQKLQKFLKTKSKPEQKNLQQTIQLQINKQKLSRFLAQNNLSTYQDVLFQNQIDSLQILEDATQKQLQQIGIPKGHALKLKVNISKWSQNQIQQEKQKILRQTKTKDSDRNDSFVSVNKNSSHKFKDDEKYKQIQKRAESICIGTEEDGLEFITFVSASKSITMMPKSRSKFCLFCYQPIKAQSLVDNVEFCSQNCSERYNQMFKKYEKNLIKAEEEFNKKKKSIVSNKKQENDLQTYQNQHQQEGFDFLQNGDNYEDFDYENYERFRKEIGHD